MPGSHESGQVLVVVGGGRMGTALVDGLLGAGRPPRDLAVIEEDPARREWLAGRHPEVAVAESPDALATALGASGEGRIEGAVLVVKPADAETACAAIRSLCPPRVLSVVAGVRVARLRSWLRDDVEPRGDAAHPAAGPAVLRAMPNTPALVGAGVCGLAVSGVGSDDLAWAEGVLGAVGTVVRVEEAALDAVTGLSGSGPAYVFVVAEALVEAGVLNGLPRPAARTLAFETLAGAARLLLESGEEPETLRAQVTSPGGTTAAGLRVLEARAVRSAILEAVSAATERSRQLGS